MQQQWSNRTYVTTFN